jgi:hypothetical protein
MFAALSAPVCAGDVNFELRPFFQTLDGQDQSVGFVGAVLVFDASAIELIGHDDTGAFAWGSSSFPSGGVNNTFDDGDAYYQAVVVQGGLPATADAAGLLITTLVFTTRSAGTGTHTIEIVPCIGATCSRVLDQHPFAPGVLDVTGSLDPPATVTVHCQELTDCDDSNPCTDGICSPAGLCELTPNDANDPDDGLFCNGAEDCENGLVVTVPDSVPNCSDGLSCTTDSCNEAGNACSNVLQSGFCLIDGVCFVDGAFDPENDCAWCNVTTGVDDWIPRPGGAFCGDPAQTPCNNSDTCDGAGDCLPNWQPSGHPCGAPGATSCTAADTCDGAGICEAHDAPNGTPCNDLQWCTLNDACTFGLCTGSGTPCPGQTCDEATDRCKAVDLELFAPLSGPFAPGDVAEIELHAISDIGVDLGIGSLAVILTWDPGRLALLGRVDNGPYDWFLSSFPNDSGLDGLNNTFTDGDAWYQASSQPSPNPPAQATPDGLHITTFQFEALAAGNVNVAMAHNRGQYSLTFVADAESPGLNMTGTLGPPAALTLVACLTDAHCDDNEFCTGVESCNDMVCMPGPPPDCDDAVFCNGQELCLVGVGCVSPGNPCPTPTSCDDLDANCGGCDAPVIVAEGSRYVRITPQPHSTPVALQLVGDPTDSQVACFSAYVQADGTLGSSPVFLEPAAWGVVHVTDPAVIPKKRYRVHTDCRFDGSGFVSAAASAQTWRWGDVNGDGVSGIDDVFITIDMANGSPPPGVSVQNVDMMPCQPDGNVDQADVEAVQAAFGGANSPCNAPCNVCITASPPILPPQPTAQNRYLSFDAGNSGKQTAVRVRFVNMPAPYAVWNGRTMWVAAPQEICENAGQSEPPVGGCATSPGLPRSYYSATLQCTPYYTDWSMLGTVHVFHPAIVPNGSFAIQMIDSACATTDEAGFSSELPLMTSLWGDVVANCTSVPCAPPDGVVESADIVGCLDKFKNRPNAPRKTRCDIAPHTPDWLLLVTDLTQILDSFSGRSYPYPPPPVCPP